MSGFFFGNSGVRFALHAVIVPSSVVHKTIARSSPQTRLRRVGISTQIHVFCKSTGSSRNLYNVGFRKGTTCSWLHQCVSWMLSPYWASAFRIIFPLHGLHMCFWWWHLHPKALFWFMFLTSSRNSIPSSCKLCSARAANPNQIVKATRITYLRCLEGWTRPARQVCQPINCCLNPCAHLTVVHGLVAGVSLAIRTVRVEVRLSALVTDPLQPAPHPSVSTKVP